MKTTSHGFNDLPASTHLTLPTLHDFNTFNGFNDFNAFNDFNTFNNLCFLKFDT